MSGVRSRPLLSLSRARPKTNKKQRPCPDLTRALDHRKRDGVDADRHHTLKLDGGSEQLLRGRKGLAAVGVVDLDVRDAQAGSGVNDVDDLRPRVLGAADLGLKGGRDLDVVVPDDDVAGDGGGEIRCVAGRGAVWGIERDF